VTTKADRGSFDSRLHRIDAFKQVIANAERSVSDTLALICAADAATDESGRGLMLVAGIAAFIEASGHHASVCGGQPNRSVGYSARPQRRVAGHAGVVV
jgi:hypothetical protein